MKVFIYLSISGFQNSCILMETTKKTSNQNFKMSLKVVGIALFLGATIFTRHYHLRSRVQPTPGSKTFNMTLNDKGFTIFMGAGIFALSFVLYLHYLNVSSRTPPGDILENTLTDSGQARLPKKHSRNLPSIPCAENAHHDHVDGALLSENEKLRSQTSGMTSLQEAYRTRLLDSMDDSRRWKQIAMEQMQERMRRLECNEDAEVVLMDQSRGEDMPTVGEGCYGKDAGWNAAVGM